jgi:hypothetical protein
MRRKIYLTFCLVLLCTSCSFLWSKYYGIKTLTSFNEKEYHTFITSLDTFAFRYTDIISTAEQRKKMLSISKDSLIVKNLQQPLQILYFKDESLVSYHINCYAEAKGRNLDWNTQKRFDMFPPISAAPLDCLLQDFQQIYHGIATDKTYTVLIFYTIMMEKLSKRAIEAVRDNMLRFNKEDSLSIFLINSDYYYIEANKN